MNAVEREIRDAKAIPGNPRSVLFVFASFSPKGDGTSLFPSLTTVAESLGRSRSFVQKMVRWLVNERLLVEVDERGRDIPANLMHSTRCGGWVPKAGKKGAGRATKFRIDVLRVKEWTPSTGYQGVGMKPPGRQPSTRYQGALVPGTRGPLVPGTTQKILDLQEANSRNAQSAFAGGPPPVDAVENSAASSPNLPADDARSTMLDVVALVAAARTAMLAQNGVGGPLDEVGLRIALNVYAGNAGNIPDAALMKTIRQVAGQVYQEFLAEAPIVALTPAVSLGGEQPTSSPASLGSHKSDLVTEPQQDPVPQPPAAT